MKGCYNLLRAGKTTNCARSHEASPDFIGIENKPVPCRISWCSYKSSAVQPDGVKSRIICLLKASIKHQAPGARVNLENCETERFCTDWQILQATVPILEKGIQGTRVTWICLVISTVCRQMLQRHSDRAAMPSSRECSVHTGKDKAWNFWNWGFTTGIEVNNCRIRIEIQCTSCTPIYSCLKSGDKDKFCHVDKSV